MPTLRINARFRRRPRTLDSARGPRTGPRVPRVDTPTSAADAGWQAIVEQLRAIPSNSEPYEAWPDTEYKWARRLGMHINRPPKRR